MKDRVFIIVAILSAGVFIFDNPLYTSLALLFVLVIHFWFVPFLKEAVDNYREESQKRKCDDDSFFTDLVKETKSHQQNSKPIF